MKTLETCVYYCKECNKIYNSCYELDNISMCCRCFSEDLKVLDEKKIIPFIRYKRLQNLKKISETQDNFLYICNMKNIVNIAREHAFNAHNAVNHKYGDNLPYEYHLTYAVNIGWKFIHLIPKNDRDNVIGGVLEHDTIEDCNLTFNNLKDATNEMIAELAYACTNEKGRTRQERANDKYYEGIRNTKYATFVKLCDRIANVEYSLSTKNRMFDMYKKEQKHFRDMLYTDEYKEMWEYLEKIML